jgi:hypothetical protein
MNVRDREIVATLMDVSCSHTPCARRKRWTDLRTKFDRNGRVTELTLGPKVLSTFWDLPSSVGKLENLRKLVLCHCNSLPSSLADLENLESLALVNCNGENLISSPLLHEDDCNDSRTRFYNLVSLEVKGGIWGRDSMTHWMEWISEKRIMPKIDHLQFHSLTSDLLQNIFDVLIAGPKKQLTHKESLTRLTFAFSQMSNQDFERALLEVVPLYPGLTTLSVPGNGIQSLQFLLRCEKRYEADTRPKAGIFYEERNGIVDTVYSYSLRSVKLDHNPVMKHRNESLEARSFAILLRSYFPLLGSLSSWEDWDPSIEYLLKTNRGGRFLVEGSGSDFTDGNALGGENEFRCPFGQQC